MQEIIDNIARNINFEKKELFAELLKKCLKISDDSGKSTYAIHENIVFKVDALFAGFSTFINEFGKDKKYEAGVEALSKICEELGIEIDKEECFILFHLRDLGKFKMKEAKLHNELKELWKHYPQYVLSSLEFSHTLKSLMRKDFINYRKGNLGMNKKIIIRYRTQHL